MQRLTYLLNRITDIAGKIASWLTVVLVVLVGFDIAVRYLMRQTAVWVNELEWHLFALIFLLGAAQTLRQDRHVRVDLFYTHYRPRDQRTVNLLGHLLFLLPWCLLLLFTSIPYGYEAYLDDERSPNPGGLPYYFIIKWGISLGFFLLLLQGISQLVQLFQQNRSSSPNDPLT